MIKRIFRHFTQIDSIRSVDIISSVVQESKHSLLDSLYIYKYHQKFYGYLLVDKRTKTVVAFDCGDYKNQRFNVEKLMKEHGGGFGYLMMTTDSGIRSKDVREWVKVHPDLNVVKAGSKDDGHIEFVGDLCIYSMRTPGVSEMETSYVVTEVSENSTKTPIVFTGTTLLTGGCGNFTNSSQMLNSLFSLRNLPSETLVFPAMEAAAQLLMFSKIVDSNNEFVNKKLEEVKQGSDKNIGQMLGIERLYNPFLRCDQKYFKDLFDAKDNLACFEKMKKMMDKLIKVEE